MQQTSQAEKEQVPGSTLKQAVLVADDNPINRKLTVRQLQRRGYTVDEAVDGREAVEAAKTGNYAAVLMDCEMPEMDGYQAAREIRWMEGDTRHTLVVAITANETESDRQKCLGAGMDEFMSKPIRLDSLVRMIEAAAATNQPVKGAADKVATSPASAGAVLDPLMIDQLREEGQDLLDDLIEMFARKVPIRIGQMADEFMRGDLTAASMSAHSLKGSAANLGAKRMQEICATLDAMARAGSIENVASLIGDLRAEYQRVRDALTAEHSAPTAGAEA